MRRKFDYTETFTNAMEVVAAPHNNFSRPTLMKIAAQLEAAKSGLERCEEWYLLSKFRDTPSYVEKDLSDARFLLDNIEARLECVL